MQIRCPHCQAYLSVTPEQAGEVARCPTCEGKFQVPIPTADTPGQYYDSVPPHVREFGRKKIAAGICGILVGSFGIHKFILGLNGGGLAMLLITLCCTFLGFCLFFPFLAVLAMQLIGIIEGVIYLTMSDDEFYNRYGIRKKEWF